MIKKKISPEINSCGVISETDINNVIRLRLTIVVGFIEDMGGNDFLFIGDLNVA
jgi:hypothetical protein